MNKREIILIKFKKKDLSKAVEIKQKNALEKT